MDSVVADSHPDGGTGEIHVDAGHPDSADTDYDLDMDHCEDCCHGHTPSLVPLYTSLTFTPPSGFHQIDRSRVVNFSKAPPTPPPTV